VRAPVTAALGRLIAGELPLDDWVKLVRAEQPEPARFGGRLRGWWRRFLAWLRRR
jgi:glycerol-3-phosphate dehydrogenase (NAD(P)+)